MHALLSKAKALFATWREEGSSRRHMPYKLQQLAVSLLAHYSAQEVSNALNIGANRLRYWQDAPAKQTKKATTRFIPLSLSSTTVPNDREEISPAQQAPLSPPCVQLNLPQGLQLVLSDQPVQQSCEFICALIKELNHASLNR